MNENLQTMQPNYVSLVAAGLGAAKLTAEAFGYSFITDTQVDAIVNLVAVVLTIGGILYNHFKSGVK